MAWKALFLDRTAPRAQTSAACPFNECMGETHAAPAPASAPMNDEIHLSVEDVAALIDGRATAAQRRELEAHLAMCGDCRAEVVSASRMVDSLGNARAPWRQWTRVGLGLAAAAGLVFLVLPRARQSTVPGPMSTERAPSARSAALELVAPPRGSPVSRGGLHFIWRRDDDASYRLFVTDSTGVQVYTATTTDTALILPDSVRLQPGGRYHWYVDGLLSDGTSVSSPSSDFAVPR